MTHFHCRRCRLAVKLYTSALNAPCPQCEGSMKPGRGRGTRTPRYVHWKIKGADT